MGTGFIFPDRDPDGKLVNDLSDASVRPKGFSISCISPPGNDGGIIALSATKNSLGLLQSYYNYLYSKNANELFEVIVKLLFSFGENNVFNIKWWNNLPEMHKSLLHSVFRLHLNDEDSDDDVARALKFINTTHGIFTNVSISSIRLFSRASSF